MADYMGRQIDRPTAEGAVARAELFVRTVEREFGLEGLVARPGPLSLEETQRKAAETWRRDYYDKRTSGLEPETKSGDAAEKNMDADKTRPGKDTALDFDPED